MKKKLFTSKALPYHEVFALVFLFFFVTEDREDRKTNHYIKKEKNGTCYAVPFHDIFYRKSQEEKQTISKS